MFVKKLKIERNGGAWNEKTQLIRQKNGLRTAKA